MEAVKRYSVLDQGTWVPYLGDVGSLNLAPAGDGLFAIMSMNPEGWMTQSGTLRDEMSPQAMLERVRQAPAANGGVIPVTPSQFEEALYLNGLLGKGWGLTDSMAPSGYGYFWKSDVLSSGSPSATRIPNPGELEAMGLRTISTPWGSGYFDPTGRSVSGGFYQPHKTDDGDIMDFLGPALAIAGLAMGGAGLLGAFSGEAAAAGLVAEGMAGGTGLTIGTAAPGLSIPAIGATSLGITAPASALLSPSLALAATGSIAEVASLGGSWLPSPSQAVRAVNTGAKLLGGGGGGAAALPQPRTASAPNSFFFKDTNMDLLKNNSQEMAQQGAKPMNAGVAPPIVDAGLSVSPLVLLLVAATVLYFMQKG